MFRSKSQCLVKPVFHYSSLVVLAAISGILGCAPVYRFKAQPADASAPTMQRLNTRIARALATAGFAQLDLDEDDPTPMVGDTGYLSCSDAGELTVFYRSAGPRTSVHVYSCRDVARIVVLATSGSSGEPRATTEILEHEFSPEISAGIFSLSKHHRLALE